MTKKRKPQDAVVNNVARLRAEVRANAKVVRELRRDVATLKRQAAGPYGRTR